MEERLSQTSVLAHLDQGHAALPWKGEDPSGFLAGIDFEQILALDNAEEVIQGIEPQVLYFALKRQGLDDAQEVLAKISTAQLTRCLDYEAWREEQLDLHKAIAWLMPYRELGPHQLGARFKELEEEYQVGLLDGLVRIYDEEEFDALPQEEQDLAYTMPCQTIRYRIMSDDSKVVEFVEALIKSLFDDGDMAYPYMLLAHAAYQPTHEAQALLAQFRRSRLEEDGFVTLEESQGFFAPVDVTALEEKARQTLKRHDLRAGAAALAQVPEHETPFLTRVMALAMAKGWDVDEMYAVHRDLLFLANGLCTAAHIEPDDLRGMQKMLEQAQGLVSLGLEHLTGGDPEAGMTILQVVHPKTLFQLGITLVDRLRMAVLEAFLERGWPEAARMMTWLKARKWGSLLLALDHHYLDLLGFENLELTKGLFNRFPLKPLPVQRDGVTKIVFEPVRSLAQYRQWAEMVGDMLETIERGPWNNGAAGSTEP